MCTSLTELCTCNNHVFLYKHIHIANIISNIYWLIMIFIDIQDDYTLNSEYTPTRTTS